MEDRFQEIESNRNKKIRIRVMRGHFATSHSHINYYIDMTQIKHTLKKANHVANEWSIEYEHRVNVDTIVSLDGTEIIGGFLAQKLSFGSLMSLSKDVNISIITPEINSTGKMIFRDNSQPLIWNKNVVITAASLTTGKTISSALECVKYYGGNVVGISTIFSDIEEMDGIKINTIFDTTDVNSYETYSASDCPVCKNNVKLDAIINNYGYSKL